MSNTTLPVRPAKSNGCFGYAARLATLWLSSTASNICPLQILTSAGGPTCAVEPQPTTEMSSILFIGPPAGLMSPRRETPHNTGSRSPVRPPLPDGASKDSQNASLSKPHGPMTGAASADMRCTTTAPREAIIARPNPRLSASFNGRMECLTDVLSSLIARLHSWEIRVQRSWRGPRMRCYSN